MSRYLFSLILLISPAFTRAADIARPAYTPPPPAVSSGSVAQIIFSLLLVIAAIFLVAWLLRRMNVAQQGGGKLLKVLGGVAIGQRERIVLVEVDDTWLVVGVGPGQIRTLHTLPRAEIATEDIEKSASTPDKKFSAFLKKFIEKRDAS